MEAKLTLTVEVNEKDFDDLAQLEAYIKTMLEDGQAEVKVKEIEAC